MFQLATEGLPTFGTLEDEASFRGRGQDPPFRIPVKAYRPNRSLRSSGRPAPIAVMQKALSSARAGGVRSAEGEPTGEVDAAAGAGAGSAGA